MIKYLFGDTSEYKEVHDVAVALINLGINTMPSIDTLLRFLEEEPKSINQQIPSDIVASATDFDCLTSCTTGLSAFPAAKHKKARG